MIGQIVKSIDPERIAAMLDTMQERVDEGLDMFEEAGENVAARIEEIDLSQLDQMMGQLFNNTKGAHTFKEDGWLDWLSKSKHEISSG